MSAPRGASTRFWSLLLKVIAHLPRVEIVYLGGRAGVSPCESRTPPGFYSKPLSRKVQGLFQWCRLRRPTSHTGRRLLSAPRGASTRFWSLLLKVIAHLPPVAIVYLGGRAGVSPCESRTPPGFYLEPLNRKVQGLFSLASPAVSYPVIVAGHQHTDCQRAKDQSAPADRASRCDRGGLGSQPSARNTASSAGRPVLARCE